ncbi:MAG: hypothetical protein AAFS10_13440, partial [Myxococcota bacterium]
EVLGSQKNRQKRFAPREAMQSLQELLQLTELSEQRLRQLLRFYQLQRHQDGVRLIMRLLDFCRCLSREEAQELRKLADPVPSPQTGELVGQAYKLHVRPQKSLGPLAELMAFVVTELAGVVYQSVVEHGLRPSDCISDAKGMSAASTFRELRSALGLEYVDLYVKKDGYKGIQLVLSRPPSIIIGENIVRGMFNQEQRFVLGRALELTRPEFILTQALSPFEFLTLFEALFERADAEEQGRFDESMQAKIRGWHERLSEVLTPEREVRLTTLVAAIRKTLSERPSAPQWRRLAQESSLRVGLVAAGDLQVAIKRLLREEERLQLPTIRNCADLQQAMDTSRDLRETLRYGLSPNFLGARAMLDQGIAGDPTPAPPPDIWTTLAPPPLAETPLDPSEDEGATPAVAEPPTAQASETISVAKANDDVAVHEPPPTPEDSVDGTHEHPAHASNGIEVSEVNDDPAMNDDPEVSGAPEASDAPEAIEVSSTVEASDGIDSSSGVEPSNGIDPSTEQLITHLPTTADHQAEKTQGASTPPEQRNAESGTHTESSGLQALIQDLPTTAEALDADAIDDGWGGLDLPEMPELPSEAKRTPPPFNIADDEVTALIVGEDDVEILSEESVLDDGPV